MQERSPQELRESSSEPTFGQEDFDQQEETKLEEREKAIRHQREDEEVRALQEQIRNLFDVNCTRMKAISDESVFNMINSLPEEVLNMQVGKFMEEGETDPELRKWLYKPFEFSDKYGLLSGPAA